MCQNYFFCQVCFFIAPICQRNEKKYLSLPRVHVIISNLLNGITMKRVFLAAFLAFFLSTVFADDNNYVVKTRNVKKTEAKAVALSDDDEATDDVDNAPQDFISKNFRYYSLCDWQEGMRFMVVPGKYDLMVNTFCDEKTGKEVSSMTLRHKVMVYKGYSSGLDGHDHINFVCQDDNKEYYYPIPYGTFDDYCYTKQGVPTLAYLGDVDIARDKLIGQRLYTRTQTFYIDTDFDNESSEEIKVPMNEEVKVTAVGVGTRNYPVKLIVEDRNGREFYQYLALSRTNSGMRNSEFIVDDGRHLFSGSFEMIDALMDVNDDYMTYQGKIVHTLRTTDMTSKGDGRERTVRVPKLISFQIERIAPKRESSYVTLILRETESGREYTRDVTFKNPEEVIGFYEGRKEDYFGYIFAMGKGRQRETSQAARAAIRQGRVIVNMTEDEVEMAVGEPDNIVASGSGRFDWVYRRSKGKLLIVNFNASGRVVSYRTSQGNPATTGAAQ